MAQEGPKTVKKIEVEYVGDKGVSKDVILSNMALKVGDPFTSAAVEEDIKSLYASGVVENIKFLEEPMGNGVKVIVVVQDPLDSWESQFPWQSGVFRRAPL